MQADKYTIRTPQTSNPSKPANKIYDTGLVTKGDNPLKIVEGVFYIYQDGAATLQEVLISLRDDMKAIPSFPSFYIEALVDGWNHDAIMLILNKSLPAVYGEEAAKGIIDAIEEGKDHLRSMYDERMAQVKAAVESGETAENLTAV